MRFLAKIYSLTFLGRRFLPLEFGIMLACLALAFAIPTTFPSSSLSEYAGEDLLETVAVSASALLAAGWAVNSNRVLSWGLALASWLWLSRAFYNLFTGEAIYGSVVAAALLNLALTVISVGTYAAALERRRRE